MVGRMTSAAVATAMRTACIAAGPGSQVLLARAAAAPRAASSASLAAAAIAANRAANLSTRACEVDPERVRKYEQATTINMGVVDVRARMSGARAKDIAAIASLKPGTAPKISSIDYRLGDPDALRALLLAASNVKKLEMFMDDVCRPFKDVSEGALTQLTDVKLNCSGWTLHDLLNLAKIAPNLETITLEANAALSITASAIQGMDMKALENVDIQVLDSTNESDVDACSDSPRMLVTGMLLFWLCLLAH